MIRSWRTHWYHKFAYALRGVRRSLRHQSSFLVHGPMAIAVVALALALQLPRIDLCILVLCIVLVIASEMFNSSVEHLARAITREHHPQIAEALDTAAGAVLVASIGASTVGLIILLPALLERYFS
ncbi:MAG: diacylglycerol kinase family protein [Planctomycetota bacterium]|nr:diacylglycerol kinase family protein [Planctomycetota bacterium]MDA1178367.1 diacylglycerol kinase family protein [Planctomycetota bacterium]